LPAQRALEEIKTFVSGESNNNINSIGNIVVGGNNSNTVMNIIGNNNESNANITRLKSLGTINVETNKVIINDMTGNGTNIQENVIDMRGGNSANTINVRNNLVSII
jgi:hypothetical protein